MDLRETYSKLRRQSFIVLLILLGAALMISLYLGEPKSSEKEENQGSPSTTQWSG